MAWTARGLRRYVNWWGPYLGAGIRVLELAADWNYAKVELRRTWYNANYFGTHFGGSLFAMTDPWWAILVMHNLGPAYRVWDKAAEIEFVAAVKEPVYAEFRLDPVVLDELRSAAGGGEKVLRWMPIEVRTAGGALVANVRKQIYVRLKPPNP